MSQHALADAPGPTVIHLNRVLRQLRERQLWTFRDGHVALHDLPRSRRLTGDHSGFLDQRDGQTSS